MCRKKCKNRPSILNYIIMTRNEILIFLKTYPAFLSLESWAVALILFFGTTCQACARYQALHQADGDSDRTTLLHPPPLWTTTFMALGFWHLFSLLFKNPTFHMSNKLIASLSVGLIFREDTLTTNHGEGRKAKDVQRNKHRRNYKAQGWRRGRSKAASAKKQEGKKAATRGRVLWEIRPLGTSFSPAPPSCNLNNPLPTEGGHPVECFNRIALLKLCLNDVLEIKQA